MGGQRPEEGNAYDHSEGEAKIDVGQVLVFARGCVSWGEPALEQRGRDTKLAGDQGLEGLKGGVVHRTHPLPDTARVVREAAVIPKAWPRRQGPISQADLAMRRPFTRGPTLFACKSVIHPNPRFPLPESD